MSTVPVYVRPASDDGDEKAQVAQRVAEQIVENDKRRALTDAQRARGIQQMIDAGLTVTKVARRLSVKKDTVKAAETAARSTAAMQALDGGQISLVEAAALTEFEDTPGAVERLMDAAGGRRFDHVVAQLREERATAEAEAKAVADYTGRGFTVLDEHPRGWDPACVPLRHLVTADGHDADEDSVTSPAHWAVLLYEDTGLVDATTGEPVDEQTIDWDTEGNAEATPAEGMRHADSVTDATVYVPEYFCLDAAAAGLTTSSVFQRNAGLLTGDDQAATVDLDADAREAARLQAETERAEAEKRERRKVIALNKLGDAATAVRRQFITTLLARKTLPKGAATFIADCLARDSYLLSQHNGDDVAAELLGIDAAAIHRAVSDLPAGSDNRALVIALALVVGALEARSGKDAWRNPSPVREPGDDRISYGHHVTNGDLLRFLVGQGYTLSAVEEVITGVRTSDEVYDEYLGQAGKE